MIVCGEEERLGWGREIGFADEAEEFFPPAGKNEAYEFGVWGCDLVSMDCSLGVLLVVLLRFRR